MPAEYEPSRGSNRADLPSPELLITSDLLQRAKEGDSRSLEILVARYRPRLSRWASGRLPLDARSLFDTNDLVQEVLISAIRGLQSVQPQGPGSFQAYLRAAIMNRIRDEVRRARRRPRLPEFPEELADESPSPLESAIGSDTVRRFERALEKLSEGDRQLIHLRIELDFPYKEIAALTGRSNADAARMSVHRAVCKLAKLMRQTEQG